MALIYIIRNKINNKVYIGQTVQTLQHRWNGHCYQYNIGNKSKLYSAMRTFGMINFTIEELEHCDYNELNEKEKKYIEKYDSFNNGYNSTKGGDSLAPRLLKYANEIIDLYIQGLSSKQIAKMYNCSDETILNLLKREDIVIRSLSRPIVAIDLEIKFESYYEAARYLIDNGFTCSKSVNNVALNISNACKTMTSAYNLSFAYIDDIMLGEYEYGKYSHKSKNIKAKNNKCKICNKHIGSTKTGMCNSCANVAAKGKSPKPSKEELQALLASGLQKKQIAKMYGRTPSTISTWINEYGV